MLKDISSLQKGLASIDINHDLENLETHLTERIATLTENAMEVNALQSETLQNLHDKVQEIIIRVNEEKKRCKTDL
jgi:archaellum component FlaC